MVQSGKKLAEQEAREIADLYAWGMEIWMICAFYDVHKTTVHGYAHKAGVPPRPNGAPRHIDLDVTSTRRRTREDGRQLAPNDRFEGTYREARETARALQAQRTEARQSGGNSRSYQAAAF